MFSVILDVGKTHVKLSLLHSASAAVIDSVHIENRVCAGGDYPSADTAHIWAWLKAQLRQWAGAYALAGIGITTHGATVACVAGNELVLPVLDYEYQAIDACRQEYSALRPSFAETLSPALPAGLNLGAQLYWLQKHFPEAFGRTQTLLLYPQYWAYLLSGRAVSEVTSLGCHTDLWSPDANDYSSLAASQGWRELFPPICAAGKSLGPIKPELARGLGLPPDCEIYNGVHDSNASLVPHLLAQQKPCAVVSSGTWTVIAGVGSSTAHLSEQKDMLANVNVFGEPTACIRFMGGREWQVLKGTQAAQAADFLAVCRLGVYAVPSFSSQGGPFRHHPGAIVGARPEALSESQKTALATLYLALMTDYCLQLLAQNTTVVIEGAFARNRWLMSILASLGKHRRVLFSDDSTGTTAGTARLWPQAKDWPYRLNQAEVEPSIQAVIEPYRQQWQSLLPG